MRIITIIGIGILLFATAAYAPLPVGFKEYPEVTCAIGAVILIGIASMWKEKGNK